MGALCDDRAPHRGPASSLPNTSLSRNPMAAIRVEHASKRWGDAHALDDVSFEVAAGSFCVLLGPSGCGKSTTLRLISGLETASAGRIHIGGRDVTDLPPAARNISMVFQSYALFPHLNVAENILFGLRVRKVADAECAARLGEVASLLGLDGLLLRRPSQLSGGQQQRVALGRAIIARAPVCLMDEPLSNLDAQLRHEMRREIRALQQKLGITMVYVTHDQTEAMSMADQVVLMRAGKVEQDAPPPTLYAQPATSFAARFIGTPPMNVVRLTVATAGSVIAGTRGPAYLRGVGESVMLGIRPEDIDIGNAGVSGVVESVEYLGADSIVECRVGDERLVVRAPGRLDFGRGAQVQLSWLRDAMHFFDIKDGRRRDDMTAHARALA